jgi:hypothetical protein
MHVIYRSVFEYFDSYSLLLDVLVPVFCPMECSNCLSKGGKKYLAGNKSIMDITFDGITDC